MVIKYFPDTDTFYIAFADREIAETVDFNDDTVLDIDEQGNVLALTLEHARHNVDLADIPFQQIAPIPAG